MPAAGIRRGAEPGIRATLINDTGGDDCIGGTAGDEGENPFDTTYVESKGEVRINDRRRKSESHGGFDEESDVGTPQALHEHGIHPETSGDAVQCVAAGSNIAYTPDGHVGRLIERSHSVPRAFECKRHLKLHGYSGD